MKEDTRTAVKHEFDHAAPTVIHDPEQDMTILARWLHRGMQKGPAFWFLAGGLVVVVVLVSTLASALTAGNSAGSKAWSELNAAQTPGQKVEVAEAHAGAQVARVARLQAASDYFFAATRDLPGNREAAGPQLQKALEQFREVAREAPKDSPEALAAAMGIARTLEARNELPEAIEQYDSIAGGWPGTAQAEEAKRLAARLKDPEVVAFYKELYTYKPPVAELPPAVPGAGLGVPPGHPSLSGPTLPGPALPTTADFIKGLTAPPLGTSTTAPGPVPAGPGPLDIDAPPAVLPPTKAESRATAPARPSDDAKGGELPGDVFAPKDQPK